MPSVVSHSVVALLSAKIATGEERPQHFWLWAVVCSILPDADVVAFLFDIRYGEVFGHRGFSHSLSFALILAVLVVRFAFANVVRFSRSWWALVSFFFLITASHGILDAMTDGGLGVAFFAPFDSSRYFLPWRPIRVSPISIAPFFSERGLGVLRSEALWIWIPLFVSLILKILILKWSGRIKV